MNTVVHTAKEYAELVGQHLTHETYRADDIPKRLLGMGCKTDGTVVQIPIAEFKATGDLETYQATIEPFKKAAEPAAEKK
ncbi:MAG TPA: hypothetical protein VMB50_11160 [Myxococcales bacterium]|nr:hypothetical protein [Myxococcales bacterium]